MIIICMRKIDDDDDDVDDDADVGGREDVER